MYIPPSYTSVGLGRPLLCSYDCSTECVKVKTIIQRREVPVGAQRLIVGVTWFSLDALSCSADPLRDEEFLQSSLQKFL